MCRSNREPRFFLTPGSYRHFLVCLRSLPSFPLYAFPSLLERRLINNNVVISNCNFGFLSIEILRGIILDFIMRKAEQFVKANLHGTSTPVLFVVPVIRVVNDCNS